ncbi:MAG: hypothetical protein JSV99_10955 [Planctomycetota bacterium]|nr:MAG: hypothetical protein JSV99_10955 [Planctomycetota bacterium]
MFHVKQLIKAKQAAERRHELRVWTVSGRNAGMAFWCLSPFGLDDASGPGRGKELTIKIAGRKEYSIAEGAVVTIAEIALAALAGREGVCSGRMGHRRGPGREDVSRGTMVMNKVGGVNIKNKTDNTGGARTAARFVGVGFARS